MKKKEDAPLTHKFPVLNLKDWPDIDEATMTAMVSQFPELNMIQLCKDTPKLSAEYLKDLQAKYKNKLKIVREDGVGEELEKNRKAPPKLVKERVPDAVYYSDKYSIIGTDVVFETEALVTSHEEWFNEYGRVKKEKEDMCRDIGFTSSFQESIHYRAGELSKTRRMRQGRIFR